MRLSQAIESCSAADDDEPGLLDGVLRRQLDAVEAEQVGGLLELVDDVVDLDREHVDVVAVERRQVLRVEQLDEIVRDAVADGLRRLHLLLRDARVRVLTEAAVDEPRDLERVLAGLGEEHEELARLRRQRQAHGRAR